MIVASLTTASAMASDSRSFAMATIVTGATFVVCVCVTVGAAAQKPAKARHRSDLITNEELKATQLRNAYEIVQALHSNWLTPRQPPSLSTALARISIAIV